METFPGATGAKERPMAQAQESRKGITNGMMAEQSLAGHAGACQVKREGTFYAKGSS